MGRADPEDGPFEADVVVPRPALDRDEAGEPQDELVVARESVRLVLENQDFVVVPLGALVDCHHTLPT